MKLTRYETENNSFVYSLDNEGIKAIRFLCGLDTDLRKNLQSSSTLINSFIIKNQLHFFGLEFEIMSHDMDNGGFETYNRIIAHLVYQVVWGCE